MLLRLKAISIVFEEGNLRQCHHLNCNKSTVYGKIKLILQKQVPVT